MGDVILDIDFQKKYEAFTKIGAAQFKEMISKTDQIDLVTQYEIGQITTEEFRRKLKELLHISHVSDKEFDQAWDAILIRLPKERLDFIQQLRKQYRVFLFSNTNALHIQKVSEICKRDTGYNNFEDCFDHAYYSFKLGMRKPEVKAFEVIIKENNLKPQETLFVDDVEKNIQGAEKAGLKTLHLTPDKSLLKLFEYI